MTPREEIGYGLDALVIFRSLQQDPVIRALMQFCHTDKENTPAQIRFYSAMVSALYERADDLTGYLEQIVLEHENVYVQRAGAGEPISPNLETCLHTELKLLNRIAMLTPAMIQAEMQTSIPLPAWQTHKTDLDALYTQRVAEIAKHGYGIYARHHMFTVGAGGELVPVQYPDPISLEQMVGYERERSIVVDNTKALLAGKYASNVLLAGDAGTGKSATVKAIANAFKDDGLRLIELNKDQLCYIPQIMDHLCRNPLKFILFIDDLTFSEDDPNFGTLKATLEGSIAARMRNTVIYATSNRRHLIKETLTDREGDDIHKSDTRQELMSLSARFGLTITFGSPDRERYLHIVEELAKQYGVELDPRQLAVRSEAFAVRSGGRSARVAKQFIELCKAGVFS